MPGWRTGLGPAGVSPSQHGPPLKPCAQHHAANGREKAASGAAAAPSCRAAKPVPLVCSGEAMIHGSTRMRAIPDMQIRGLADSAMNAGEAWAEKPLAPNPPASARASTRSGSQAEDLVGLDTPGGHFSDRKKILLGAGFRDRPAKDLTPLPPGAATSQTRRGRKKSFSSLSLICPRCPRSVPGSSPLCPRSVPGCRARLDVFIRR